jgi:hypothetical protein
MMNVARLILMFVMVLGMTADRSLAASPADPLSMIDKDSVYDIYYGGSYDGASYVAKRVKIIRIQPINGVDFLVFINDSGFNAKAKEGYILFSTIKAIVPESTFTIIGNERS